jgi:hypothetical protein
MMIDDGVELVVGGGVLGCHVRLARVFLVPVATRNQARLAIPNIIAIKDHVVS